MDCLTKFNSPQLKTLHRGKVRDSIRIDDQTRMIVVTDRISAFNKKIQTPIPTKGAVLNGIANFWFEQTQSIIKNHVIQQVDDYITLVQEAEPIRVEMVVRGYLTGSMWRGYEAGQREFSGVRVGEGLQKNQKFDQPILTPTTKDDFDTAIDEQGILEAGIVSPAIYQQMKEKALALFQFGSEFLAERGIILVDTKYEFGLLNGELILIDEMHTPDSSRFWNTADYAANPSTAEQIDKEFVRQWMLANKVNGEVPTVLSDEVVAETSRRYQEIYERVTGKSFELVNLPAQVRIYNNLLQANLLKAGFVSIVMDEPSYVEEAKVLKGILESYDLTVDRRIVCAHATADRLAELALDYNTSIEPVAVLALGSENLAPALAANLSVPVIDYPWEDGTLDLVIHAILCSLNIPSLRQRLAAELQAEKNALMAADTALRN